MADHLPNDLGSGEVDLGARLLRLLGLELTKPVWKGALCPRGGLLIRDDLRWLTKGFSSGSPSSNGNVNVVAGNGSVTSWPAKP
jgi:hypothetical protein